MSRIANNPITIPSGVDVNIAGSLVTVKGSKGEMSHDVHPLVKVEQEDGALKMTANNNSKSANALSGTTRALLQNIVTGVSDGFERKLEIVGVNLSVCTLLRLASGVITVLTTAPLHLSCR